MGLPRDDKDDVNKQMITDINVTSTKLCHLIKEVDYAHFFSSVEIFSVLET